jgi:hypothetical protein
MSEAKVPGGGRTIGAVDVENEDEDEEVDEEEVEEEDEELETDEMLSGEPDNIEGD